MPVPMKAKDRDSDLSPAQREELLSRIRTSFLKGYERASTMSFLIGPSTDNNLVCSRSPMWN